MRLRLLFLFLAILTLSWPALLLAQCDSLSMIVHLKNKTCSSFLINEVDSVTLGTLYHEANTPHGVQVFHVYGDGNTYCAFTSLVKRADTFYLAFREGTSHVAPDDYGVIKILSSTDGIEWHQNQTLSLNDVDLRDPNISIMPDGRLMLVCGARMLVGGDNYETRTCCFLEVTNGIWGDSAFADIPKEVGKSTWLWRLTWHGDIGYGVSYGVDGLYLLKTLDGVTFDYVRRLEVGGNPSECRISFSNDKAFMLVRRDSGNGQKGYLGVSDSPYTEWDWKELNIYLAGQDFLIDNDRLIVGTRMIQNIGSGTVIWSGSLSGDFSNCFLLPYCGSGWIGDTGYTGIIKEGTEYWVSYYAVHNGEKPSVFLARIPVK